MSTLIPLGNLLRDYTTGDEILWAEDRAYLEHAHQDRLARIRDELAADSFPAVAVDHTELGSSTSIRSKNAPSEPKGVSW